MPADSPVFSLGLGNRTSQFSKIERNPFRFSKSALKLAHRNLRPNRQKPREFGYFDRFINIRPDTTAKWQGSCDP